MLADRTENMDRDLDKAISAIEGVVSISTGDSVKSAVVSRLTRTFVQDLLSVNLAKAEKQMSAMGDHELLAHLVLSGMDSQPAMSREARLKLQGRVAFREMISAHGGVLSQQQASEMLGISPDGVRKRASRDKLLAIKQGDHHVYPVFQFGDNGEVVPHFDEVLELLDSRSDVARVRFFLAQDSDLGKSVIEALNSQGDLDVIRRKARSFGKQGAT